MKFHKVNRRIIYKILIIIAIVLGTLWQFKNLLAIRNIILIGISELMLLLIFMILDFGGYVGLCMSLVPNESRKREIINCSLLFIGLIGFIGNISLEGGKSAWLYLVQFEEPGASFLVLYPQIIILILLMIKFNKFFFKTKLE